MKLGITQFDSKTSAGTCRIGMRAFSLVEVMMVAVLLLVVVIAVLGSIFTMQMSTSRGAQYNSAMALCEAKLNDIRAVYYNPPIYPFTTNTIQITNQSSISLDTAGTTFLVSGSLVSKVQYCGSMGHLVTVTASYLSPTPTQTSTVPVTVSLQTMVNKYSGGQR